MHTNAKKSNQAKQPARKAGRGSLLAVVIALSILAAWKVMGKDQVPIAGLDPVRGERHLWVAPNKGPVWCGHGTDKAKVILAGDSRARAGIDLLLAESLGSGSMALAWGMGAKTEVLIEAFLADPNPRSMVVALSPIGLVGSPNPTVEETLREWQPAFDHTKTYQEVRDWMEIEEAHLVAEGFDPAYAKASLGWWAMLHRKSRRSYLRETSILDTHGIDTYLGHFADRSRNLLLNPIEPAAWNLGFLRQEDRRRSDDAYQGVMKKSRAAELRKNAQSLALVLGKLKDRGWRLAAIRLPTDPGIRTIEDDGGAQDLIAGIVEELDIPFMDYGVWPDSSSDGSHLHLPASDRATRIFVPWLHEIWPD